MATLKTFTDANYFAFKAHEGQLRNGVLKLPYIVHPLEVVNILARAGYADNYRVLSAAVLHDVIEDCGVTFDTIQAQFGSEVANLVDTLSFPAHFSKANKILLAPIFSDEAAAIKTADLISNINSITEDPTAVTTDNAYRFVRYALAMFEKFDSVKPNLANQFALAISNFNLKYSPKEI